MTLQQEGAKVEAHSASLKKELGVRDLALTQILFIIGLTWIGVAGKLGPSHVVLWLTAVVLFYLPLTAVVIWPLPVGETRLQPDDRLHGRLESVVVRDPVRL